MCAPCTPSGRQVPLAASVFQPVPLLLTMRPAPPFNAAGSATVAARRVSVWESYRLAVTGQADTPLVWLLTESPCIKCVRFSLDTLKSVGASVYERPLMLTVPPYTALPLASRR